MSFMVGCVGVNPRQSQSQSRKTKWDKESGESRERNIMRKMIEMTFMNEGGKCMYLPEIEGERLT